MRDRCVWHRLSVLSTVRHCAAKAARVNANVSMGHMALHKIKPEQRLLLMNYLIYLSAALRVSMVGTQVLYAFIQGKCAIVNFRTPAGIHSFIHRKVLRHASLS